MRAFASDKFGDLADLTLRDVPKPTAGAGQLLIHVRAAAVNPADFKVLAHRDGGSFLHASTFPLILGYDFSGVIAELGANVTGRAIGDEVYGFLPYARSTRGGTYAEFVVVGADAVGAKPKSLSHAQAAAAATSAVTALQGLRKANLAAGQAVLINGASGGVGSYAVQIAKTLGAVVSATASSGKLGYVTSLGATKLYDYAATPVGQLDAKVDVVFDVASNSSFGVCARLLEPGGSYVTLLPSASTFLGMGRALFSSKRCKFVIVKPVAADFDQISAWFDDKQLTPILDGTYPLAELRTALEKQRAGDVRGKLAITIDEVP